MKTTLFYSLTILLVGALAVTVSLDREAVAQTPINIKVLHTWSVGQVPQTDTYFLPFIERVNKRGAGRVNMTWKGPEAVPPFEQLEALRKRVYDLQCGANSYETGDVPAAPVGEMWYCSQKERRKAGWYDWMNKMYLKRAGVMYLSESLGPRCITLLRKPVTKVDDFKGMKVRVSQTMDPFFTAMGAKVVVVKPGEIYSALERGVVDGIGWGGMVLQLRFNEVTKYIMKPYIMGPACVSLKANPQSWNSFPKDVQKLIMDVAVELENETWVINDDAREEEVKLVVTKYNMQVCTLLPEEAKKMQRLYDENGFAIHALKHEPEFGPKLKEIADPYLTK